MPVSLPDHATPRATGRAIVALALVLALPWPPLQAADAESLAFLTWADYLDPGLEAEFERETGIECRKVRVSVSSGTNSCSQR